MSCSERNGPYGLSEPPPLAPGPWTRRSQDEDPPSRCRLHSTVVELQLLSSSIGTLLRDFESGGGLLQDAFYTLLCCPRPTNPPGCVSPHLPVPCRLRVVEPTSTSGFPKPGEKRGTNRQPTGIATGHCANTERRLSSHTHTHTLSLSLSLSEGSFLRPRLNVTLRSPFKVIF